MFYLQRKTGSWFILAKYLKNTCGRDILSKDATLYLNFHTSTGLFQVPGFYMNETLVKSGLKSFFS